MRDGVADEAVTEFVAQGDHRIQEDARLLHRPGPSTHEHVHHRHQTTSSTMPTTRVNQAADFVAGKLQ